jgi:hypothetical protein
VIDIQNWTQRVLDIQKPGVEHYALVTEYLEITKKLCLSFIEVEWFVFRVVENKKPAEAGFLFD